MRGQIFYSEDFDNTKGAWICFNDGHKEFWSNTRLLNELRYRGLAFLKTQLKFREKQIVENIIKHCERLKCKDEYENEDHAVAVNEVVDMIIEFCELTYLGEK